MVVQIKQSTSEGHREK
nr:unnamed protein product [Callosobruchus chinensis]CAH7727726.1 unnamed protein product [Callosobruchus chinensis]CAH7729095.1 unnamed protein product [Callosobruchus chinensis]CAH7731775.1 unnamed protein product [Callosobruchus chinensis]CAH7750979.1 unnamed protein product [Callosobruchus chinensis]